MIRLARKTSLLVAFYLLTSAATAYAECAWVLWSYEAIVPAQGPRPLVVAPTWHPVASYQMQETCSVNEGGYRTRNPGARYVCLPDTVDPRGSKGGAR